MNTLLLFGGMDDDYEQIVARDQTKKTIEWEFLKDTRCGDRLLIYFNQPHSAILATAVALEDAWIAKTGNIRGKMGHIRLLKDPISFAELRFLFPNWPWLKYARSKLYLDEKKALMLWQESASFATSDLAAPPSRAGSCRGMSFPVSARRKGAFLPTVS